MQTEQRKARSQDERDKIDGTAFFIPVRTKCSGSDLPGAMPTPPESRFSIKYKDFMTTSKDDNERAENHGKTLKDPNLDEYHSMKGREEDDVHKPKTSQNQMYS